MTINLFEFIFIEVPELFASVALLVLPLLGVCWGFVTVINKISALNFKVYVRVPLYIIMVYVGITLEALFAYGALWIISLFPMA